LLEKNIVYCVDFISTINPTVVEFSPAQVSQRPALCFERPALEQGRVLMDLDLGVSINGGSPIAGWFISWTIPLKMDVLGVAPFS
jgi:hypothetical protein